MFCIPFAGGSRYSYRDFAGHVADFVNVVPVELPGRGSRFSEPLLTDMHALALDVFEQVKPDLNMPYAIYGHSMGGTIGYLLMSHVRSVRMPPPVHFFVSGRSGPSCKRKILYSRVIDEIGVANWLRGFEGTPGEVLEDESLMEIFAPVISADIQAVDNYEHREIELLNVPFTVMVGLNDGTTTIEEASAWQRETARTIKIEKFPGGHFFIFQNLPGIGRTISDTLEGYAGKIRD